MTNFGIKRLFSTVVLPTVLVNSNIALALRFISFRPKRFIFRGLVSVSLFHLHLCALPVKAMTSSVVHDHNCQNFNYVSASDMKVIDQSLMSSPGFSLDQLMELAGLSVATSVYDWKYQSMSEHTNKNILVICGPGNNGGDGLVAARHLKLFGTNPTVVYPKPGKGQLFVNLLQQCKDLDIPILDALPAPPGPSLAQFAVIVDALFGFSFEGTVRPPFDVILQQLATSPSPVLSVDVPSGWNVDDGDVGGTGFLPQAVVSLTAPKLCMRGFTGVHYLGGRFVPPHIVQQFNLQLPEYPGSSQIVLLSPPTPSCVPITGEGVGVEEGKGEVSVMYSTAGSKEEAEGIAGVLLDRGLVACVNVLPGVTSLYVWQGKRERAQEWLLLIKTRTSLVSAVTAAIQRVHSYDVAEAVALPVVGGSSAYLDWVRDSTAKAAADVDADVDVANKPTVDVDNI